ncbi:hypothetical protein PHYPO_G00130020 [Pangasianodon hypophthalmus]|uniref:Uncharacterized protein n=1 Tax=Pangasianodon hypophthalmus TaxID=310915 RepID=A0A5N5KSA4_PANHP|nr:hypothetical protein PHYPO_G00130020 [Pangasianodon hypophthalmus]
MWRQRMKTSSPLEGRAEGTQCMTSWGKQEDWTLADSHRHFQSSTSTKQMKGMMERKARALQTPIRNQRRAKRRERNGLRCD